MITTSELLTAEAAYRRERLRATYRPAPTSERQRRRERRARRGLARAPST